MRKYGKKTLGEKIRAKQFKKSIKKIYDLCTYKDRACIDCDYSFHTYIIPPFCVYATCRISF